MATLPKSGEDTMTKEEAVKETPKEIFLKDYRAPDYAFEKVLTTEHYPNGVLRFLYLFVVEHKVLRELSLETDIVAAGGFEI
jgi:hypothetical protein